MILQVQHRPFFIIVFLTLIATGCHSVRQQAKEIKNGLETINGDGNVQRTALTYSFLNTGNEDTLVNYSHYALPANAAFPSNTFEGKLTLHNLATSGKFRKVKDRFNAVDSTDIPRMHLPAFDYEFVQTGSHIIPLKRGYLPNEHPDWEYILEPGRVWDEKGDNGFSRVAIPFTLKQKNQNCVHNGVLMFLFKNNGTATAATYQVAIETCAYFKFDMWGTVKASYSPYSIPSKEKVVQDYLAEVKGRMPTKPISELSKDYPGANPHQFSAPHETTPEHMTFYGFVIDGTNYVGGFESRAGKYPFINVLTVPSYSTAKSISAGVGLMRLEKLYPGSRNMIIGNLVNACKESGNWSDVTIENALDMATGNYESLTPFADEGARNVSRFFSSLSHQGKIDYACSIYSRKAPPGTQWVYHTWDTYLVGTAMNAHLRNLTGNPKADYFNDLIVADILKPLGISPTTQKQQTTYDSTTQPFSGYGLFYHPDDVAKIGQFLNSGAKIRNAEMLDASMFSSVMKADRQTGLISNKPLSRYKNGFWLRDLTEWDICNGNQLIPVMEGYGGIKIFLLPNNTVYYLFSDNYEYAGRDGIMEANRIRPFCPEKK